VKRHKDFGIKEESKNIIFRLRKTERNEELFMKKDKILERKMLKWAFKPPYIGALPSDANNHQTLQPTFLNTM